MKIYLVGGAVRDELMGVPSNDRDYVVVGASEADMVALGYKKVGADFPVFMNDAGDQFALARKERKTGRGYLGFETTFDPSVTLEDDLLRRDLTINAIAKDMDTGEIVDPFGGRNDLHAGILRHVSDAFAEDPLRVVRLARFYARWPLFDIAWNTIRLVEDIVYSGEMDDLADERFYSEMEKMFAQSKLPSNFFELLYAIKALDNVKFFKDLLGEHLYIGAVKLAANTVKGMPQEQQLPTFVALAATSKNRITDPIAEQTSSAIPVYTKKLTSALDKLRRTPYTTEGLFQFLAFTRAFDKTSTLSKDVVNALNALNVLGDAGRLYPIEAHDLDAAIDLVREVSAEKYMHLSGAEIGKALNAERLEVLRKIVK